MSIRDADLHKIEVRRSDFYRKGDIVIEADTHGEISLDFESVKLLIGKLNEEMEKCH